MTELIGWILTIAFGFVAIGGLIAEGERHFGSFSKMILSIIGVIILVAVIFP